MPRITTKKILNNEDRQMAFEVLREVYLNEKSWIKTVEEEIPANIDQIDDCSWFLAMFNGKPAGVLRLVYDPPLEMPSDFEVKLDKDIDLDQIARNCRFVEIGRFAILPRYRRNIYVALKLMQISIREVVERDYTHFLTDVFEGEVNSPLRFHTKVLGFEVIGSHLHGDLNCSLTRIILTLDILKAYQRIKSKRNRVYRTVLEGSRDLFESKIAEQSRSKAMAA